MNSFPQSPLWEVGWRSAPARCRDGQLPMSAETRSTENTPLMRDSERITRLELIEVLHRARGTC